MQPEKKPAETSTPTSLQEVLKTDFGPTHLSARQEHHVLYIGHVAIMGYSVHLKYKMHNMVIGDENLMKT